MKNRKIIYTLWILTILFTMLGGTFAYLSNNLNVTNGAYSLDSHCFNVDYNINNVDGSQDITGTLFPSSTHNKGLSGRVSMKINSSCDMNGMGELKLHINSTTSSKLTTSATSYCENKSTLEAISGITTKLACNTAGGRWQGYGDYYCESNTTLERLAQYNNELNCTGNGGTWKSGGSPLKYAVYNNESGNGSPLSVGYITSSDIGNDKTIYNDFVVTGNQDYYYIFIWLDGYLTDSTYTNLPFSGYITANAMQVQNDTYTITFDVNGGIVDIPTKTVVYGEKYGSLPIPTREGYIFKGWSALPSEYQEVEYIESTGPQYIDTGYMINENFKYKIKVAITDTRTDTEIWPMLMGAYGVSNSSDGKNYAIYYAPSTKKLNGGVSYNLNEIHTVEYQ